MNYINIFEYFYKITFFNIFLLFSSYGSANNTPSIQWAFQTTSSIYSSVTGDSKTLYAANIEGKIYALTKTTGELLWANTINETIYSDIILSGKYIYFQSEHGYIYKIQKENGKLEWRSPINTVNKQQRSAHLGSSGWNSRASAPVVSGEYVYVESTSNHLHALNNNTGRIIWKFNTLHSTNKLINSAKTFKEKNAIAVSLGGIIYCVDKLSGEELWHFDSEIGRETPSRHITINSNPTVKGDLVIIGSHNSNLYTLGIKDGSICWVYPHTKSWVETTATVYEDTVYVGSSFLHSQHAIDLKNGMLIWQKIAIKGLSFSKPTITHSSYYTGIAGRGSINRNENITYYGGVLKLDKTTGREKWRFEFKEPSNNSKEYGVVGSIHEDNGTLYFAGLDGKIYSIK